MVTIVQVKFDFENNSLVLEEQVYPEMPGLVKVIKSVYRDDLLCFE